MFDRMDVCEAYYVFAMLYHEGQFSDTYTIFGRLDGVGFKPRPGLRDETSLSEGAREVFDRLVAKHNTRGW